MALRFDDFEHGIEWSDDSERLRRTGHAMLADGRVWLTDVVDAPQLDDRVRALGEPTAVAQLLDRHSRDCAAVAGRLGIPHHVVAAGAQVEGAPFTVVPLVQRRVWRESALWLPAERILVCGDALGSLGYFRAKDEPFGVHPLLRLFPPRRPLAGLEPEHILFGHGSGFHGPDTPEALREALATSRRRLARTLLPG